HDVRSPVRPLERDRPRQARNGSVPIGASVRPAGAGHHDPKVVPVADESHGRDTGTSSIASRLLLAERFSLRGAVSCGSVTYDANARPHVTSSFTSPSLALPRPDWCRVED